MIVQPNNYEDLIGLFVVMACQEDYESLHDGDAEQAIFPVLPNKQENPQAWALFSFQVLMRNQNSAESGSAQNKSEG